MLEINSCLRLVVDSEFLDELVSLDPLLVLETVVGMADFDLLVVVLVSASGNARG